MCGGDNEYLAVEFVDGPDGPVEAGRSTHATVHFLAASQLSYDVLVVGAKFDICEGGQVVGLGEVTRR
jgi:hypothetical protein